ncbi:hypothetical protein D8M04_06625 [Oceanobacillus piezotolerans]|uniref:Enoyl reductase (ER) domain-containing protein n=1 Tax=Oceanobacillus piezotolerans TaxID=2448030 RepID=A0A498DQX0_9BACI|nr:zinc-binding dehydrogenase [Oceanobacillus piezotolerans]RLL46869.1 hypothetical protein D8M04_06625 [Oceanobacillus piezotolerans]
MKIPKEMKAARFYKVKEPLKIDTVPVPEIKEDEVLVEIKSVGLCGSDIHMVYEGDMVPVHHPIIIGHEPSGIIASKGKAVDNWEVGTRVSVYPVIYCGSCKNCIAGHSEICFNLQVLGVHRDGGLAEYLAIPAKNLLKLPDNIPYHIGSIVTDAVATPFHALIERAQLQIGESVAIYGVGGLGLHAVQIARMAGAKQIIAIDIQDKQLEKAKEVGADIVINPLYESPVEVIKKHTGHGVDVAAEFIGKKETVSKAANSLITGGRLVVSGVGYESVELMSIVRYVRKQLTFYGSFGHTKNTVQQLINLVSNKRLFLEESITHEFQLEEVNTALEYLYKKIDAPTRILINI